MTYHDGVGPWPPTTNSRTITVYCDGGLDRTGEPRHAAVDLATLEDRPGGPQKWRDWLPVAGDGVELQQLIHPDDQHITPELLGMMGRVAHRYKIVCETCGLDATIGDQLSQGYETTQTIRRERRAASKPRGARERLSEFVAAGESRLSLSALGRILTM